MSDPIISQSIAAKMFELHSLPVKMIGQKNGEKPKPCLWQKIYKWMDIAESVEVFL